MSSTDQDPSRTVHIGRDGWLFLVRGSNDVIDQYRPDLYTRDHLYAWRRLIEARARRSRDMGIPYFNIIVPEKLSVYDDRLGSMAIDVRHAPAARVRRALWLSRARRHNIDLLRLFRAERDRASLYLKTDTHWSFAGCHLAYLAICRRLDAIPNPQIADPTSRRKGDVSGDLGSKFDPPLSEVAEGWHYPHAAERVHVNRLLGHFLDQGHWSWGGVGAQAVFRNEAARDQRRVVLFGDSYAHQTWLPLIGSLTPMLAETFRELHFVWASGIDWNYVQAVKPDILLTEIAERFMAGLPPLHVDLATLENKAIARKIG